MLLGVEFVFFVLALLAAVLALQLKDLLISAIILAVFSFLSALLYISMGAVDVGFNEAVLGAGITGIFFIAAIYQTQRHALRRWPEKKKTFTWLSYLIPLFLLLGFGGILMVGVWTIALPGDPLAPASTYLSPDYIRRAYSETHTPNVVTAMIADFRSFDTLGEVLVVFTAALACFFILGGRAGGKLVRASDSPIIEMVVSLMVPVIQIFALYVIFHGHYGPGGGFQGGALLAASIILQRIFLGKERSERNFPSRIALPLGVLGIVFYVLLGVLGIFGGKAFLDYAGLPFLMDTPSLHSMGILLLEISVALVVFGALVSIFDSLASEEHAA